MAKLIRREQEILTLLIEGKPLEVIRAERGNTESSFKTTLSRLMSKLYEDMPDMSYHHLMAQEYARRTQPAAVEAVPASNDRGIIRSLFDARNDHEIQKLKDANWWLQQQIDNGPSRVEDYQYSRGKGNRRAVGAGS